VAQRRTRKKRGQVVPISEAARIAGVGRSTLYRHLKKGTLSAVKHRDGSRGIDLAELARVYPQMSHETSQKRPRGVSVGQNDTGNQSPQVAALVATMQAEVKHLRERVEFLERELADTKNRENRLLGILEQRKLEPPGGGLWQRLFGGGQ